MNRRATLALIAAAWLGGAASAPASAQTSYPSRPIKLMVPFSAGGVTDVVGRQWAERMTARLGAFVIENRGGGGGVPATIDVARAEPDGHTLVLGNTSIMVLNPMTMSHLRYDPPKDFAPVAILAIAATAIIVHKSVPAQNLKELIAYAKANPGKLSYGSAGTGTMTHLAGEMFKQLTGTGDIAHVPYKGAGPGISDLIAGHIPMMTPNITGQYLELHKAGAIRILAINAEKRLQATPDIPTAIEQGLPGMVGVLFVGVSAPAATPKPIIDKIAAASRSVMADVEFQKVLREAGLEPVVDSGPEQARKFLEDEHNRWQPVVKTIGLKIE